MAQIQPPQKVKFIVGMISSSDQLIEQATELLQNRLGLVDIKSETFSFDHTKYYEPEMGANLKKYFVSFQNPADPGELAELKIFTNQLEENLTKSANHTHPRAINLDPGYIAPSKLILASMKDFSHRIYLASGVYAEVTLQWRASNWQSLPWTFPDFAAGTYFEFLTSARQSLMDSRPKN